MRLPLCGLVLLGVSTSGCVTTNRLGLEIAVEAHADFVSGTPRGLDLSAAPVVVLVEGDGSLCQPFSLLGWTRLLQRMTGRFTLVRPITAINRACDVSEDWRARDFFSRVDELDLEVRAVRAAYPGRPVVLLGHSAGAHVAMLLLARRPDAADALVNLSGGLDALRGVLEALHVEPPPTQGEALAWGRSPAFWKQMLDSGVAPLWRRFAGRCLVLHGTKDLRQVPFAQVARDAAHLEGRCAFRPLEGAGHDTLSGQAFEVLDDWLLDL